MLHNAIIRFLCVVGALANGQLITVSNGDLRLNIAANLQLQLFQGNTEKLTAQIAKDLGLQNPVDCDVYHGKCKLFGGDVKLDVQSNVDNGFTIEWSSSNTSRVFRDCYDLKKDTTSWFGGPERWYQYWPAENLVLDNFANVAQENSASAVVEPYWLNSAGAYVYVDEDVPLFIDENVNNVSTLCFVSKVASPYSGNNGAARSQVTLKYTVYAASTAKEAHMTAVKHFLGKPTGYPNRKMIERPVWSTWARYKRNVSDDLVLAFAQEILDNGFSDGQFELDDYWETCYGSLTFRTPEFAKINDTVKALKSMGFRVTLWAHPFININCDYSAIARGLDYLVKDEAGSTLTQWWNSNASQAEYIDFTKPDARDWYYNRLLNLKNQHGIDSYKFDAGESSWAPQTPILQGDLEKLPNKLTSDYVRTCARFGDLVEVRSAWKSQDLPIFVRMIDKDSHWGVDNGLYTLITTLLQMNMNGYSLVLPDMVGGNGYDVVPSPELFVRWLQANTFMPSIQFSYVPWDYATANVTYDVVEISKKFVALHTLYTDEIVRAMEKSVSDGVPTNPPVWWIHDNPTHEVFKIDTQYVLGEDVVVAPVVQEGATTRNVYLPSGTWVDGNTNVVYQGSQTLQNYAAPIDVLPYFVRQGSNAEEIHKGSVNGATVVTLHALLGTTTFILFYLRF